MSSIWRKYGIAGLLASAVSATGCAHHYGMGEGACDTGYGHDYDDDDGCGQGLRARMHGACFGWCYRRSPSIPDALPLGSTVRSHYQVMETNAEAMDFIIYRREFMGETATLNSDGKDHILEIAARMRSAPFPVIVERTENNADPELDAARRNIVAQILTDHGNPDAQQRTVVGLSYGPGYESIQAESMYYQHVGAGGGYGAGYGGSFGTFGGFAGGAGGGVGFGP